MRVVPFKGKRSARDAPDDVGASCCLVFFLMGLALAGAGGFGSLAALGWLSRPQGFMVIPPLALLLMGLFLLSVTVPFLSIERAERRRRRQGVRDGVDEMDTPPFSGWAGMRLEPGTTLPIRLERERPPVGGVLYFGMMTLLFNGAVACFVAWLARGFPTEHLVWMAQDPLNRLQESWGDSVPVWVLTVFFCGAGVVLLYLTIRIALDAFPVLLGMSPPEVEVSAHPIRPDEGFELWISQAGPLRVEDLLVLLICEEKRTYREGDDTRDETKAVQRNEILRREDLTILRGKPYQALCPVRLRDGAPFSVAAEDHQILWHVGVMARVLGRPVSVFKFRYPVIVNP